MNTDFFWNMIISAQATTALALIAIFLGLIVFKLYGRKSSR